MGAPGAVAGRRGLRRLAGAMGEPSDGDEVSGEPAGYVLLAMNPASTSPGPGRDDGPGACGGRVWLACAVTLAAAPGRAEPGLGRRARPGDGAAGAPLQRGSAGLPRWVEGDARGRALRVPEVPGLAGGGGAVGGVAPASAQGVRGPLRQWHVRGGRVYGRRVPVRGDQGELPEGLQVAAGARGAGSPRAGVGDGAAPRWNALGHPLLATRSWPPALGHPPLATGVGRGRNLR
jgi:hypothetical protein